LTTLDVRKDSIQVEAEICAHAMPYRFDFFGWVRYRHGLPKVAPACKLSLAQCQHCDRQRQSNAESLDSLYA
jgi:hypothetical protein